MAGRKSGEPTKICPVCNCRVKQSNLAGHVRRVHGSSSDEETEARPERPHKGRRAEMRKMALVKKRRARNAKVLAGASFVVLLALVAYLATDSEEASPPTEPPPPQTATSVRIPLSQLSTSSQFYTFSADGVVVRYFAVVGSDGDVHIAFDACDVCYSEKKGYRQAGGVMKCNNCGREFAINSIGTENLSGGCWPSFLPTRIDGGDAVVDISDLSTKRYMFV